MYLIMLAKLFCSSQLNVRYWLIITNIAVTRFLTSAEQKDYLIVSDSIGDPHTFSPQLSIYRKRSAEAYYNKI